VNQINFERSECVFLSGRRTELFIYHPIKPKAFFSETTCMFITGFDSSLVQVQVKILNHFPFASAQGGAYRIW